MGLSLMALWSVLRDFNPPTPCGVGRWFCLLSQSRFRISIHPPRAGWDKNIGKKLIAHINFNPPTPCGVGPDELMEIKEVRKNFNPPTPCGVGLSPAFLSCILSPFQSTHPVRGGTVSICYMSIHKEISIHPPRAGWDSEQLPTNQCMV